MGGPFSGFATKSSFASFSHQCSLLFFLLFLSLLDRMTHQNLSFITNINITGTRDERAQLVAKIVQYQKRLQKLRRDLMRRKYGERSLEKTSLVAEKEEEKEVVVQLTASSSNGSETKRNDDDALHLETIIEDEELRRLVDNSDDDESGEENGGDRNTNNNSSISKKKTKKTAAVFDRSLSAMPRLMKKTNSSLDGDTREGRDSGGGGGVFDWLLDALDALDDKIAEKVERAEDALFDAFEDVQDSFKKTFSFQKKKKNKEEKNDDDEDNAK